jgi:hypothetical protein
VTPVAARRAREGRCAQASEPMTNFVLERASDTRARGQRSDFVRPARYTDGAIAALIACIGDGVV